MVLLRLLLDRDLVLMLLLDIRIVLQYLDRMEMEMVRLFYYFFYTPIFMFWVFFIDFLGWRFG